RAAEDAGTRRRNGDAPGRLAVADGERSASADGAVDGLLVRRLRMVLAAVDTGEGGGRIRRAADVYGRGRSQPGFLARADEATAVVDARRGAEEVRAGGECRRRAQRDHAGRGSRGC